MAIKSSPKPNTKKNMLDNETDYIESLLINAIFQSMPRLFDDSSLERSRDKPSVLLCAPTGMAAFNILGQTMHAAFNLPVNQSDLTELSADVSNTMRTN
jgi:ATP-dependent protease Clp ATPase subunit